MKKFFLLMISVVVVSGCATGSREEIAPGLRDSDPMIVQLSNSGRQAFVNGEVAKAVVMFRRALDRARAMDNSREISRSAYNLAACLIALGDVDAAEKLLAEAEREAVRAGEAVGPVMLLAAEVARRQNDLDRAETILNDMERGEVDAETRGQAYVLRAHLACDRGDASRAEGFVNRAMGFLGSSNDPVLDGAIAEVSGRIAGLNGQWASAAEAYDREALAMQRSARLPEMARALEKSGQHYLKAENMDAAADRFFRSSRSLMAQGNYLEALRVIEQAAPLQPGEKGEETMAVIAELLEEIRQSIAQQRAAPVKPAE